MTDSTNPLAKHFRKPAIYIELPSKGKWYKDGNLTSNPDNVPVLAMTAMDEILVKTPEALINGTSTLELLKSCVPSLTNPGEAPVIDIDKLLVAIRIATYGHEMDVSSQCPHCGEVSDYLVDIRTIIDSIGMPDFSEPIGVNGCAVYFRPATYNEVSALSQQQFIYEKTLQALAKAEAPDAEQYKQVTEQIKRTVFEATAINISKVITPDGIAVENHDHILEFISSIDKNESEHIKNKISILKAQAEPPKFNLVCSNEECAKDFTTSFEFDLSRFFA